MECKGKMTASGKNAPNQMPNNPIWEARPLIDRLEDPFTMFPVESVSDMLFAAVEETEARRMERRDWYTPTARKYWTPEDDHDHETVGLLLGSIFVLGQAAITQTVSLLNKLSLLPLADTAIPSDKTEKLCRHTSIEIKTNRSKMVVINAVSNYFKHHSEWPDTWSVDEANKQQAETIRIIGQLGMKPEFDLTDNLHQAASCLGLDSDDPRAVATGIQDWREAWARVLYRTFRLPDPLEP
jgi:hypothetical protein